MRKHLGAASAQLAAGFTVVCTLLALACGSAPAGTASSPAGPAYPVQVSSGDGSTLTIKQQPQRIVSLSPTATEMLFAIGAGKQVIAVDELSDYPASAPVTKLSGYRPNLEAIAGYTPDLVVAAKDTGSLVSGLAAVKVPALINPAAKNLNDTYDQISQLGKVTGHVSEATALVAKMKSEIAGIVASATKPTRQLTVYHELDKTYYSATSRTFIGQVYVQLGLRSIADSATGASSDYPQLSSEFIVSANPDLIVLADSKCCGQNLQTVSARPGWRSIAAVRSGRVISADDAVVSRWGPRVVDFMRELAPQVSQAARATPGA
jgi:iron complex transport system substrate-binding protein